jgi:hypothetical protein
MPLPALLCGPVARGKEKKAAWAFASKLCVLLRQWLSAEEPPERVQVAVSAIHFTARPGRRAAQLRIKAAPEVGFVAGRQTIRPGRQQLRAGRAGTLRGFNNENAAFAPVFSPVSGARRIGPVIIANPRKNSANLWQGT